MFRCVFKRLQETYPSIRPRPFSPYLRKAHPFWREHNMLGKRLVLIFTKTLPKPRRILVKPYNTHLLASYRYTRYTSKGIYSFYHEISFNRKNIARFLCVRTYGDIEG